MKKARMSMIFEFLDFRFPKVFFTSLISKSMFIGFVRPNFTIQWMEY